MKKEIRLVTARDIIMSVAERWKGVNFSDGSSRWERGPSWSEGAQEKYNALLKLDMATMTPAADIEAVIGNDAWTDYCCLFCEQESANYIEFVREKPGYRLPGVVICCDCIREAAAIAEEGEK